MKTIIIVVLLPYLFLGKQCEPSEYIEYREGTGLPLIISAPHGGSKKPKDIANRTCKGIRNCRNKYSDYKTRQIAEGIYKGLEEKFGEAIGTPHLVVSHLHRKKLDPNRKIEEGVECKKCIPEEAYKTYHCHLENAVKAVEDLEGGHGGLLLDVHGHAVKFNGTMVGYRIRTKNLNKGDWDTSISSIRALAEREGNSLKELMQGENSFGALMEKRGYSAVPSNKNPSPDSLESGTMSKYFEGGYILNKYGSKDGGKVDAIQTEFPAEIRWKGDFQPEVRNSLIKVMVDVLAEFLSLHYNVPKIQ